MLFRSSAIIATTVFPEPTSPCSKRTMREPSAILARMSWIAASCAEVSLNGNAASACMVHNPNYDFNDDNIAVGAAYWVHLAERFLNSVGMPS